MKLYVDQYGQPYFAETLAELKRKVSTYTHPRVSPMYVDKADGTTVRCGYVIAGLWLTAYSPSEEIVS